MKKFTAYFVILLCFLACKKDLKKHVLEFRVTVPESTPADDFIYIKIFGPEAYKMTEIADHVFSFKMEVEKEQDIYYAYQRNNVSSQTVESTALEAAGTQWDQLRHVKMGDRDKTLNDTVTTWRWLEDEVPAPPSSQAATAEISPRVNDGAFRSGITMYDYYTKGFLELTASAAQHQLTKNMNWVQLAINPAVIKSDGESFAIDYATANQYDEESLRAQLKIYAAQGVKVKLILGLLDAAPPAQASEDYWDRRFVAYTDYLKWLGNIAQQEGVREMTLAATEDLPGHGGAPESNKGRWAAAISSLRSIFKGQLSIFAYLGSGTDSIFALEETLSILDNFDSITITMWDPITHMDNPTVDDLQVALAAVFDKKLKPLWETYKKPIMLEPSYVSAEKAYLGYDLYPADDPRITTFSPPDPNVAVDYLVQANIFEAIMREVARRSYITGVFIFGQPYWKSLDRNTGLWGKPAEEIIAAWYARLQ